jgi:hypothetical protein
LQCHQISLKASLIISQQVINARVLRRLRERNANLLTTPMRVVA